MADPRDDYDDGDPVTDCPNCGGEGSVACCFEEHACIDPESGCDECLQNVSEPFGLLAQQLVDSLPQNPERTAALRKLLEAKDCAVRALIYKAA